MGYDIQRLSNQTNYNLSPRNGTKVAYIVVHYTATMASAKNNVIYFSGGNRDASADFFIDDTSIWQFNPDLKKWFSWHCGDGHGKWGITNSNSIGIEVVSDGRDFSKAEIDRLAWLVTKLMKEFGIDANHVVRHYDASRKECPLPYIDNAKWQALRKTITSGAGKWVEDKKGWWYRYPDGSYPKSQWLELDGKWYYFEASGYAAQNKWLNLKNAWYWFKDSCAAAQSECVKVKGKWYAFESSCAMLWKVVVNKGGDLKL